MATKHIGVNQLWIAETFPFKNKCMRKMMSFVQQLFYLEFDNAFGEMF